MATDDKPCLCGGTFFVLVLQALKQRKGIREHFKGDGDGMSDPEVLIGLIKVINPDYDPPKIDRIRTKTNDFKACKLSKGEYLPFGYTQEVETFNERVRTDYQPALADMTKFVNDFIDRGEIIQKDVKLVKALIDLIQLDDSIRPDESFYILEDGGQIKKTALNKLNRVCLPSFLLGVWHYVVVNRKDNKVGKATYDEWCPKNGGGPRKYHSDIGNSVTMRIETYMPTIQHVETTDEKNTHLGNPNTPGDTEINLSEENTEERSKSSALTENDSDLLQVEDVFHNFRKESSKILKCLINRDLSVGCIPVHIADTIDFFIEDWYIDINEIQDQDQQQLAKDILQTLSNYRIYFSEKYMRFFGEFEGENCMIVKNCSAEEGDRLRDEFQPNTMLLRNKMLKLYKKLWSM
jgi:hypothetical protein